MANKIGNRGYLYHSAAQFFANTEIWISHVVKRSLANRKSDSSRVYKFYNDVVASSPNSFHRVWKAAKRTVIVYRNMHACGPAIGTSAGRFATQVVRHTAENSGNLPLDCLTRYSIHSWVVVCRRNSRKRLD